ncbi:unnamed protein product [Caenorhabditis nigoni]
MDAKMYTSPALVDYLAFQDGSVVFDVSNARNSEWVQRMDRWCSMWQISGVVECVESAHHQQLRRRRFFGNTNEQMHKPIGKFLKRWMLQTNGCQDVSGDFDVSDVMNSGIKDGSVISDVSEVKKSGMDLKVDVTDQLMPRCLLWLLQ